MRWGILLLTLCLTGCAGQTWVYGPNDKQILRIKTKGSQKQIVEITPDGSIKVHTDSRQEPVFKVDAVANKMS